MLKTRVRISKKTYCSYITKIRQLTAVCCEKDILYPTTEHEGPESRGIAVLFFNFGAKWEGGV
jgi:hypothetical protein